MSLPEIEQTFLADLSGYMANLDRAIAKAGEFAAASKAAEDAVANLADVADAAATLIDATMGKAAGSAKDAAQAIAASGASAAAATAPTAALGAAERQQAAAAAAAAAAEHSLAGANREAAASARDLGSIASYLNSTFGIIVPSMMRAYASSRRLSDINNSVAASFGNVRSQAAYAALSEKQLASINESVTRTFAAGSLIEDQMAADVAHSQQVATASRLASIDATLALARAGRVLADVQNAESGSALKAAAANKAAASTMNLTGRFWFLNRQVLHWIVMGTLEIASTAIPAMVAFGAAMAGMAPTFGVIKDRLQSLNVAAGGLHGMLGQLGIGFGNLTQKMAPDAYIIFGSVLSGLMGHMGAFSKMAQQAGNVLAAFATKLSGELSGQLGNQIVGFFAGAVKFMIQWGQVLGNLGHTFVNVMHAMWGVGQGVLDVFDLLSRALAAVTGNPVVAWFIGIAAAMSAVYRYGRLLMTMWTWLGGKALVAGIKKMAASFMEVAAAEGTAAAVGATLSTILLPLAAIGAAIGIWYLATRNTHTATDQLISSVQKASPSFTNLTGGILRLGGAMAKAAVTPVRQSFWGWLVNGSAMNTTMSNVITLGIAMTKQVHELISLEIGMAAVGLRTGAVGAGMKAMAIQTALADAKVSQLNQSLDQYMALVTGGTGGMAQFTQSLANIGQVAGTTANNLGTATGSVNLSAKQFSAALSSFSGKGAGAWTNFDQIIGSTMPQLMDWFRQASTLGAATGTTVKKAALDMAAAMVKYAGSNRTARAEVLAFMRAQGSNYKNWGALLRAIHAQRAGQADLTKKINATTIALSGLNQMAKNTATALSQQVSSAIASSALKASHFNVYMQKGMTILNSGVPGAAQKAQHWFDLAGLAGVQAGQNALKGAQAVQKAAQNATGGVQRSAQQQQAAYKQSLAKAQQYQRFLDTMHGPPTIYVNTVFRSSGGTPQGAIPGHAAGTASARRGPAIVGEKGPELVFMGGGEQVLPHHQTKALLNLAGAVGHHVTGYAGGTTGATQLWQQLTRELSVISMRITHASSVSGMNMYFHNLLSTIKQLAAAGKISHAQDSQLVTQIRADNTHLAALYRQRAHIIAQIHKADQYARTVSQNAQQGASLSSIAQGAGGPVSSAYLLTSMRADLQQIRKFDTDIRKLRALGLDKALLGQIIQMGPAQGDQIAMALINGPLSNIKSLNSTESQVQKASRGLGRTSANMMFDTGRQAGKGFLSGLRGEERQIERLMQHFAQSMVKTLRRELGIHSPSTVTRQIGRGVVDGMALGITDRLPSLDSSLRAAAGHVPSALAHAARGGGGTMTINLTIPVQTMVDGKIVYETVQTQSLRVNKRNPGNNLSLRLGRG